MATALALLLAGCGTDDPAGDVPDVVDQGYQSGDGSTTTWAPDDRVGPLTITGTDYEGGAHDLAQWRGDVVLLNTWYAACPPCRAEAPDLAAVATDYADQGLRVLGINSRDAAGTAQAFQRQLAVPYPSLDDTSGAAIATLQGVVPVNAVPTTVLLDREGRVAARVLGLVEPSTLRALVEDLLAEGAGSASSGPDASAWAPAAEGAR
ncbi:TlpA family protein disulfide reductase [Cellulomonas sp. zg-ZUI222]|uniref:TlpA family protein disulfide reductase n=1 Tax=Cellulomonas wangleii TaxID=2816956 RepID=A0ABX8DA40_9CELL|nr:TlpA disulfide reductase family protein [Cellulomonas sp. zg-ZUI22]MBO0899560.1 TlpA family protein disulfide reductase [Cellulomonas sp. zg-ZUI22]MBO0920423.1 TlpA family protein disulfide reductase [Cellulomonas wangleii]MBO0923159.1 TlpA family protein disulfide reductase [Cellulomonas wangleii]QVI64305.1 TlpA family protein disulfide reductase [Cellulomonas wangleii]